MFEKFTNRKQKEKRVKDKKELRRSERKNKRSIWEE